VADGEAAHEKPAVADGEIAVVFHRDRPAAHVIEGEPTDARRF
jgi:hypothetical protein